MSKAAGVGIRECLYNQYLAGTEDEIVSKMGHVWEITGRDFRYTKEQNLVTRNYSHGCPIKEVTTHESHKSLSARGS